MSKAKTHPIGGYTCHGITRAGRQCRLRARYHYETASGICRAHYCGTHHAGRGPTRLLRPFPWEYSDVKVYST